MNLSLQSIARAVGGEVSGRRVLAPGPGHSPKDRSLAISISNDAPDGFILHSFGGPQEVIGQLAELGAYFSLPGYFAHERKERQRDAFRHVPPDRLLIETDAPDQILPEARIRFPLQDVQGRSVNHPANLVAVYEFAAEILGESVEKLADIVEANFKRLFGTLV